MKAVILALVAYATASPYASITKRQSSGTSSAPITDISTIQRYWGQITPYFDNNETYFGVNDTGLPDGCQIEQVHLLERHGSRFPTGYYDDGLNDANFAEKLVNLTKANASAEFTGELAFLNGYEYKLGSGLLVGRGAVQSFDAGVTFWQRYGRTLYNATAGQLAYNASFPNGTARPKPTLRTTGQSRIWNSEINWALGFFGPSFETDPNPTIANATSPYNLVVIPEGGTENNTLASYDSCFNDNDDPTGQIGDINLIQYLKIYLKDATERLQQYAPSGFNLTVNDTYAMQSICAYETNYLGSSSFCNLFTLEEWQGFEQTLDIEYYYDYSFGNPTGRAQGIGYLLELLSRLQHQPITSSNSSINATIDANSTDFPLNQHFYADFSHDDILVSVLTAMSFDYLKDPPSLTAYPPNPNRHFILSHLTPFAAKLITEVVGCGSSNPEPVQSTRTYTTPTQFGYDPNNATYKFVRMRLNHGILPLSEIRGGACGNRTDGMCARENFLDSQKDAYELSQYDYACFGNYTISNVTGGVDYDGAISASNSTRRR
ncbi:3-phytase A [Cyphellophora attinorum]|uniref:3-phytase n=1 Tax=Cyphellophora attinorum TaxID=1664694 RepID=A0A0N1P2L7_9EURO|nr:3-phytase A [Phialophora attinorum]KPI44030.1 3-phytase A [Phialophora attinorum]